MRKILAGRFFWWMLLGGSYGVSIGRELPYAMLPFLSFVKCLMLRITFKTTHEPSKISTQTNKRTVRKSEET